MGASEFAKIARLAALFGADPSSARGVTLGIGDDAAILRPEPGRELVWTVDAQVEGQHFRREWMAVEDVGWRSFVAAASDLAAMGADPWCALSALAVPDDLGDAQLDALARGQADAARAVGCPVVGGNLSRAGELSMTTTLLGSARHAVRRGGAEPGDGIWLAGDAGLASLGLRALTEGRSGEALELAILRFRRPVVNTEHGRALAGRAHAAIDVSDGLVQDAGHVATASAVSLVLDEASLEAHAGEALRRAASELGVSWLAAVLEGGEDYCLLATAGEALPGFTRIGEVEAGRGVRLRAKDGGTRALDAPGFDHWQRKG